MQFCDLDLDNSFTLHGNILCKMRDYWFWLSSPQQHDMSMRASSKDSIYCNVYMMMIMMSGEP